MPARPKGYFLPNKEYESDVYQEMANYIEDKQYKNIGLYMNGDQYEYPLWRMLINEKIRIEHINVGNETKRYMDDLFEPDCIIVLNGDIDELEKEYGTVTQLSEEKGFYILEK